MTRGRAAARRDDLNTGMAATPLVEGLISWGAR
jgi:hypothetical protein